MHQNRRIRPGKKPTRVLVEEEVVVGVDREEVVGGADGAVVVGGAVGGGGVVQGGFRHPRRISREKRRISWMCRVVGSLITQRHETIIVGSALLR